MNRSMTLLLAVIVCQSGYSSESDDAISFGRQIRPFLSDNCFACHGPDEKTREADLRLDLIDTAIEQGVIVPGDPDESEVMRRLLSVDEEERMPPRAFHKEISPAQIETVRRWIADGAPHQQHWSYRPLQRPPVPKGANSPIDAFILDRLDSRGLKSSPQADRTTLARRLYFDLVGVPPTFADVQQFLDDDSEHAIENLVERLLLDRRFGQRMAVYWLDLVRYADTIGYHNDTAMEVSAYRDYVINSFNDNKPFDQFTIEQLAGDLLPDATQETRIASGYNRLLQTTEEGGAQDKEYIAIYAADRVRNVSGVWMGQTVGCAQCHDHKYDPITAKDFYSMAAFFADIKEKGVGRREANLKVITPENQARIDELNQEIANLSADHVLESDQELAQSVAAAQANWEQNTLVALFPSGEKRSPELASKITTYFRSFTPLLEQQRQRLQQAQNNLQEYMKTLRSMLVVEALPEPRMTRILARGNWLDESGEVVEPAVPEFLPHEKIEGRRANRLDLARWIVAKNNPLTARTFVNRLWKLFYGEGLSRNLDDLGGQGQAPSHPELLDWLAVEFIESGWNIKHLVQLMVTSDTYRQSSTASEQALKQDPENRFYGRQNRWRVEAEFVRDAALSISGLLVNTDDGGQSVKPYQPAGYWRHLNFPEREWQADEGDKLYRRSLYTFWCRTFPHPSMLAFDAPSREECTAERARSNIPQQALVLLNDPIFLEASRVFAQRIAGSEAEGDVNDRIVWAMRTALSRSPSEQEVRLLSSLYENQLVRFRESPQDADALVGVGASPVDRNIPAPELAAWTQVARSIFNAYETTSRF